MLCFYLFNDILVGYQSVFNLCIVLYWVIIKNNLYNKSYISYSW